MRLDKIVKIVNMTPVFTSVFTLEDVCYRYPSGAVALAGVSFAVQAGQSVAVLGANGSGKSTLLKLLDGLLIADGGNLCAWDDPLTEAALNDDRFAMALRRRIGFVFQDADAMLFCATVRDELAFAPTLLGLTTDAVGERVQMLLRDYGLEVLADRAPYELSGGEKRRVCLAAALSTLPEVVLMDEPTTSLDPRSQDWLADRLLALREAGTTILLATHDLPLAREVTDRAIVFGEDHCLHADGATEAVLADVTLLQKVNLLSSRRRPAAAIL